MALYDVKLSNGLVLRYDLDAAAKTKFDGHRTHGCVMVLGNCCCTGHPPEANREASHGTEGTTIVSITVV